jgi:hypothetical protein
MNKAKIERLIPDAQAAALQDFLPVELEKMAQSSWKLYKRINRSDHSGHIWRQAFRNLLDTGNVSTSDLSRIARSHYANKDILWEILGHSTVDDSVLDEVARNEHATSEILLAIVRHGRLGVIEMEEPYHEYDWQPGSARWRYETRIRTEIARLPTSAALYSVARNKNATTDILMHIVQHPLAGANEGYGTLMRAAEHREADERVLRQILNDTFIEGSTLLAVATNRHVTQNRLLEILDHPRATYIVEEVNNLLSEMRAQQRTARGRGTFLDDLNSTMGRMQLSSGPSYAQPTYASNARQRAIAERGSLNRNASIQALIHLLQVRL